MKSSILGLLLNIIIVFGLIVLGVVSFFYSQVDAELHMARIEKARLLQQETSNLIRNTFLVQNGEVEHFDYIAKSEKKIESMLKNIDSDQVKVHGLIDAMRETLETVSLIKSNLAIYHNSLSFFSKGVALLYSELSNSELVARLHNLERAVMQFNAATSNKRKNINLVAHIDSLELENNNQSEALKQRITQVLRHTNVLIKHARYLQALNRQLLTNQVPQSSQQLIDYYRDASHHKILQADQSKNKFFFTLLLLILFVIYLWWKQQRRMVVELQNRSDKLNFMAHYDMLTKLPNRTLFADRCMQAMGNADRQKNMLAICFIDLDGFKLVNDDFGHNIGDDLLVEVAKRINANIRAVDTASRLGGDEFTLLLCDVKSTATCSQKLGQICRALAQPYLIHEHAINISISLGVTFYPNDHSDLDTLIRHADQAMYQAKVAGKNQFYMFNSNNNQ